MANVKKSVKKDNTPKEILKCPNCDFKAEKDTRKFKDGFYKCMHFKGANIQYEKWGVYPLCKDCIKKICYDDSNNFLKDKFVQMLRDYFNRPFLEDKFNDVVSSGKEIIGEYFKIIGLKGFSDMTWEDGEKVKEVKSTNNKVQALVTTNSSNNFELTQDIIERWGEGYTPDEYRAFEKKWYKLIDNYGEKTSFHTENLITYIRLRVKEEFATSRGDSKEAKEWGALADKAAQNAKINVSQLSKSDISGGVDLICQIFEAAETEVGIIPLLPKLLEQPYDDADMIIWANINYMRRLEDKPRIVYRDVWNFYDEMLEEYFTQQGFNDVQKLEFKKRRNNIFRDLGEVYKEPVYEEKD